MNSPPKSESVLEGLGEKVLHALGTLRGLRTLGSHRAGSSLSQPRSHIHANHTLTALTRDWSVDRATCNDSIHSVKSSLVTSRRTRLSPT